MRDFEVNMNIHYGIYENAQISDALALTNVIKFMAELIEKKMSIATQTHILNFGSREGKSAHYLALNYGCQVTCVNNCRKQNKRNYQQAEQLGITHLINIVESSFEELPLDWDQSFDIIWSQEAFSFVENKHKVIQEAKRVLIPGGICVFTDLMGREISVIDDLNTVNPQNTISSLADISDYLDWGKSENLKNFQYHDLSSHLGINFQKMSQQLPQFSLEMTEQGISEDYLNQLRHALVNCLEATNKGVLSWGCFYMTKALDFASSKLQIRIAERNIVPIAVRELTQENVGSLGLLFANEDWEKIQVPLASWTSLTGRKIIDGYGKGTLVNGEMTVAWDSKSLSAYNEAINYNCPDIAYRDGQGNIYLDWFNGHEDGGQAFICPGKKVLYIIAEPLANPKPENFQAFISDGRYGVIIHPGVWHTNPIPLEDDQIILRTRQCGLNATVDCHLASEYSSWLKISPSSV